MLARGPESPLQAARRAPPPRPGKRTESCGPRKGEQKAGPGGSGVRRPAQARPAPRRPRSPGTAAFTVPAPPARGGRRLGACCGRSAAGRRPQLRPGAGALAPPIVKRTGRRPRVQSQRGGASGPAAANPVSRYSGVAPAPSNRRPSRAQVQRPATAAVGRGRAAGSGRRCPRAIPPCPGPSPRHPPNDRHEARRQGGPRSGEGAGETNVDHHHPAGQSGHAAHLLRAFGGSGRPAPFAACSLASPHLTPAPHIRWASQCGCSWGHRAPGALPPSPRPLKRFLWNPAVKMSSISEPALPPRNRINLVPFLISFALEIPKGFEGS